MTQLIGCSVLLILTILVTIVPRSFEQNIRGAREGRKKARRQPPLNSAGAVKDKALMIRALTINYPLSIFETGNTENWRDAAKYSTELVLSSQDNKSWKDISQAQDQEDVWLYENWFYGMEKGVILESGALNGILFSNSFMFEQFANWTAIHVEADPENYSNLKVNRERSINVHGALCSEPRLLHYSSLGVVPVRGFVEFMTPSFIKKWHGKIHNNKTRIEDLPTVQCLPVKLLLRELNVKHVDIWILDLEGAEESALQGTDFNEVHFNSVAMECDAHDISKNKRKTDILEANGFTCILIERNCMCKHNSYKVSSTDDKSTLRKWNGNSWGSTYKSPDKSAALT